MNKTQKIIIFVCIIAISICESRAFWIFYYNRDHRLAYKRARAEYKIYSQNGLQALEKYMAKEYKMRKDFIYNMLIKDKPPEEIKKFFDDFLTIVYYEDIKPMQDDMVAMHLTALCLAIFGASLFLFKKIK